MSEKPDRLTESSLVGANILFPSCRLPPCVLKALLRSYISMNAPPRSSSTSSPPHDGRQSPVIWSLTPSSTLWELKIKGPLPCFLHCQPFPPSSMAPPHVCVNNCLSQSLTLTPSLLLLSSPLLPSLLLYSPLRTSLLCAPWLFIECHAG